MKEETKVAKKKATKKNVKTLESILDLNANNIWDLDEFAIADAWEKDREGEDFSISEQKLLNTIRLAFEVVHYNPEDEREAQKYENGGWAKVIHCDPTKGCVAIRRKAIERITDLSYENIRHITAATLLELISRNFGGGWDSIPLSVKDIIESGFEISTTTLPASRIHAAGGTLERKVADGFEVLEIAKGSWTEAIFAKKKAPATKLRLLLEPEYDEDGNRIQRDEDEELEDDEERDEDVEADDEDEAQPTEDDETFYSSYAPEADVKDEEDEDTAGLSVL